MKLTVWRGGTSLDHTFTESDFEILPDGSLVIWRVHSNGSRWTKTRAYAPGQWKQVDAEAG